MDTVIRVQIRDENVCISHSTNTLWKVCIQLFSLQLWVNSGADFNFGVGFVPLYYNYYYLLTLVYFKVKKKYFLNNEINKAGKQPL